MLLHILLNACTTDLLGNNYKIYLKNKKGKQLFLTTISEEILGWMENNDIVKEENSIFTIDQWQKDQDTSGRSGTGDSSSAKSRFWGINDKGLFCCAESPNGNKPFAPEISRKDCKNGSVLSFPNLTKLIDFDILPGLKTCNTVYRPSEDHDVSPKDVEENKAGVDPNKRKEPGIHKLSNLVASYAFGKIFGNRKKPKEPEQKDDGNEKSPVDNKEELKEPEEQDGDAEKFVQIELLGQFVGTKPNGTEGILHSTNTEKETQWEITRSGTDNYKIVQDKMCLGFKDGGKDEKEYPAIIGKCDDVTHEIHLEKIVDNAKKNNKTEGKEEENKKEDNPKNGLKEDSAKEDKKDNPKEDKKDKAKEDKKDKAREDKKDKAKEDKKDKAKEDKKDKAKNEKK